MTPAKKKMNKSESRPILDSTRNEQQTNKLTSQKVSKVQKLSRSEAPRSSSGRSGLNSSTVRWSESSGATWLSARDRPGIDPFFCVAILEQWMVSKSGGDASVNTKDVMVCCGFKSGATWISQPPTGPSVPTWFRAGRIMSVFPS